MARRSSRERCFFLWNTIIVINRLAPFPHRPRMGIREGREARRRRRGDRYLQNLKPLMDWNRIVLK